MSCTKIALGADHRGFALKTELLRVLTHQTDVSCEGLLASLNLQVIDCGAFSPERSDYPLFAQSVVEKIVGGEASCGILLCGTGAGMAMAANRVRGIRAAVVWNPLVAARVRQEDECNVLVLPADYLDLREACACTVAWQQATFKGGRYASRVAMLDENL